MMYEAFFGLRERPFDLSPNPRFLLMTGTHQEALANLHYGFTGRKGLTLLVGEAGAGKTTLVCAALGQWKQAGHAVAYLNNPTLTRGEFVEALATSFELSAEAAVSKTRFLSELTAQALQRHHRRQITGLLIDEAQSLTAELLEEVRLLVNIETADEKIFQVILAGQPELAERLNQPGLRQIKQRIALRCRLEALDVRGVAAYIAGRIHVAGGTAAQVFTREAVVDIAQYSAGIPRVISVICDNALLGGFAAGRRPVTREMIEEVCRDFEFRRIDAEHGSQPGSIEQRVTAGPRESLIPAPEHSPGIPLAGRSTATANREPETTTGLFEHYASAAKRRLSFFSG